MIVGIGTDIIEIGRVGKAIASEHFRARVYTPAERAYCESRGAGMAASFAGTLLYIEMLDDALGCPQVAPTGHFRALAEQKGVTRIFLSLSHAREYATAQCVMEHE